MTSGTVEATLLRHRSRLITLAYDFYGGRGILKRVITLVSLRTPAHAMKAGDLKDTGTGEWIFACPRCGFVAYLDHKVQTTHDQISISPSIECINPTCDFHDVITGWELRRAYKKDAQAKIQ
jgi:hypothetical protein